MAFDGRKRLIRPEPLQKDQGGAGVDRGPGAEQQAVDRMKRQGAEYDIDNAAFVRLALNFRPELP